MKPNSIIECPLCKAILLVDFLSHSSRAECPNKLCYYKLGFDNNYYVHYERFEKFKYYIVNVKENDKFHSTIYKINFNDNLSSKEDILIKSAYNIYITPFISTENFSKILLLI